MYLVWEHILFCLHWDISLILCVASICLGFRRSENGVGEECTFQEKVKAAMVANYSAAIIYNYKNDELIPMGRKVKVDDCDTIKYLQVVTVMI